ncbi:MAG: rod shape-determining protein RodA [Alphaproteobacteria bacterium]|nr:rod shape-determining protein RodA [Alphaproteobacteria bacterium]
MVQEIGRPAPDLSLFRKLLLVNWGLVALVLMIAGIGIAILYSAAGGAWSPWASRQLVRLAVGLLVMVAVALIDIRLWLRYAYLIYGLALAMLVLVDVMGRVGGGAQRWIDFGVIQLQPSELMKIAVVLALGRYFHGLTLEQVGKPLMLIPPLLLIGLPVVLVLRQPNLGTAMLLAAGSAAVMFAAGVRIWKFLLVGGAAAAAIPIAWSFLKDYQKRRVYTFVDPSQDPLGAGYNILQSKIALGSGGIFGKGFLNGTQGQLRFLPEMQTDFIFTVLAEEFGMVGCLVLLGLYVLVLIYGFAIAVRARSQFGRLVAIGVTTQLFLYVFINMAMVMGLVPVVGIPLPLVSYGGTAMLTLLAGAGLLISVSVHRDVEIPRWHG